MRSQRRNRHDVARSVEDLEGRVVLSALGAFGSWQTMLRTAANSPAQVQRAVSFSSSPFQYAQTPTRNFGLGVATWRGTGQMPAAGFPGALATGVNSTPQPTRNVVVVPHTQYHAGSSTMRNTLLNPRNTPAPTTTPTTTPTPSSPTTPTTTDSAPAVAALPPKVAGVLNTLYQEYSAFVVDNPDGTYYPPSDLGFPVVNNEVGVYVNGNGQGDFTAFRNALQAAGMTVSAANDVTWTVSGLLPISALPAVANTSQTLSVAPQYGFSSESAMRF